MPRVPVYENTTQQLNDYESYSSASGDPQAFGVGLSQSMMQASQSLGNISKEWYAQKEKDDETFVADDFANRVAPRYRQLSEEYQSLKGREAVERFGEFRAKSDALQSELLGGVADQNQRRILSRMIAQQNNQIQGGLFDYYTNQKTVFEKGASEGMMNHFMNTVKENPYDDEKIEHSIQSGIAERERWGQTQGLTSQEVQADINQWKSDVWSSVLTARYAESPEATYDFMVTNRDRIPNSVETVFTEKLRPIIEHKKAMDIYNTYSAKYDTPPPPTSMVNYNTDGKGFGGGFSPKLKAQYNAVPQEFTPLIKKYADLNGLPPRLVQAVIFQESKYNPYATGPQTKWGKAKGLMQIIDATGKELGLKGNDFYIPEKNIEAGTRHLGRLAKKYNGNYALALAAYNAGEGHIDKAIKKAGEGADTETILSLLGTSPANKKQTLEYTGNIHGEFIKTKKGEASVPPTEKTQEQIIQDDADAELKQMNSNPATYATAIVGQPQTQEPYQPVTQSPSKSANARLADAHYQLARMRSVADAKYSSGEITKSGYDVLITKANSDFSVLEAQVKQDQVLASQGMNEWLLNNPNATMADVFTTPNLNTMYQNMEEVSQRNFRESLTKRMQTRGDIEVALNDPETFKVFQSRTGGKDASSMPSEDVVAEISTSQKLIEQSSQKNVADYSLELKQRGQDGRGQYAVRDTLALPWFKKLSKADRDTLITEASNVELKASEDKVSHFTNIAIITGDPELLTKMDGWDTLKGSQKDAVLSVSRNYKALGKDKQSQKLRTLVLEGATEESIKTTKEYMDADPEQRMAVISLIRTEVSTKRQILENQRADVDRAYLDKNTPKTDENENVSPEMRMKVKQQKQQAEMKRIAEIAFRYKNGTGGYFEGRELGNILRMDTRTIPERIVALPADAIGLPFEYLFGTREAAIQNQKIEELDLPPSFIESLDKYVSGETDRLEF